METRLHPRFIFTRVSLLALTAAIGCDSQNVTGTKAIVGPISIAHDYVVYQTAAEYRAAFAAAETKRQAAQPIPLRKECGQEPMNRMVPAAGPATHSLTTPNHVAMNQDPDPFWRIGALHVYKVQSTSEEWGGIPFGVLQLFYPAPGRWLNGDCSGGGTAHYGSIGDPIEYSAVDDGYGNRPMPNPPADPPPGFATEPYANLTPGEKELVWWKYYNSTPAQFAQFVNDMYLIKDHAETWAALQTPEGQVDGPQDALRHTLWMCLMSRQFGETFARDWGWAHEEGNTDSPAGIMDLHNNAVGRRISLASLDCEDGVRFAWDAGWLIEEKGTLPNSTMPRQPFPPGTPPPLDQ